MEYVTFLLVGLIVLLILALRFTLLDRLHSVEREVRQLREELKMSDAAKHEPLSTEEPPVARPAAIAPRPQTPRETEPFRPVAGIPFAPPPPPPPPSAPPPAARPPQQPPPKAQQSPVEPTDWEKFIGENLISKIGIAILVLAIGFFVKYAIDNDWIGPVGRVGVGLVCGGVLIGLAHRLRYRYKAFSSVLIAGGIAVLYFTIALAYHQYALFGHGAAFVLMLVITAFAVAVSLLYDREELAVIALVGGYVTPFLVSNGSNDYVALFTYLLILNTGLLVIAYRKAWRLLNILAFGFTVILFGAWLLRLPDPTPALVYYRGAAFATAFYILFLVATIAKTIRENKRFVATDFVVLLLNTGLYFGVSLYFLSLLELDRYKGLYCAIMGVTHITLSVILFRRRSVDKNILYLLIGLTLSFVSLTAPLQLHGHYITLFWASESVLLYWLYLRSNLQLIRISSQLVWAAMLVSLIWDWVDIYGFAPAALPVIFNKGFMTGLYCSACCFAHFRMQKGSRLALVGFFAGGALLYLAGALEISQQLWFRAAQGDLSGLGLQCYTWTFVLGYTILNGGSRSLDLRSLNGILLGLVLLLYLLTLPWLAAVQDAMLNGSRTTAHFWLHWLGAVVIVAIFFRLVTLFRKGDLAIDAAVFSWAVAIAVVVFLSAEGQLLVNILWYSEAHSLAQLRRVYEKTALPILWGICSFACMWAGMQKKFRPLRIFSLLLFTITLLKLFLFDIRDIPIAGKIAAFFCLGVLLLVVSFMYQRLKNIIVKDEAKLPD